MASKISPVKTIDFSSEKWWWKERSIGQGFVEVADELKRKFNLDEGGVRESVDRESVKQGWYAATKFPSEVHVELLARKVIPHPYVGFNEHQVQWVGETEWLYTCTFNAPAISEGSHKLSFDGLDTLCDVYLNGQKILQADNAFRQWIFDTRSDAGVIKATDNVLLLHFKCAKTYAKAEEAARGKVRAGSTNLGDPSRVYLRKPQYDWRWDWGPELMTCGPYRGITLTTYTTRIEEFNPQATLECIGLANQKFKFHLTSTLTLAVAHSAASLIHDNSPAVPFEITYAIKNSTGEEIGNGKQAISKKDVEGRMALSGGAHVTLDLPPLVLDELLEGGPVVEPWWPVGYGDQNLYTFEMNVVTPDGDIIDSVSQRIGWRSVELVQDTLEEADQYGTGTSFFFRVNGVDMFMGGSNWIPADNFLTTISDERYRNWLTLLRDGGQNMVRIWGGGIYEPDIFYDVCDELGILVWQDFQFACGVYPAHEAFVDSVRKEAVDNVKRLRRHPSMALFCGNNEDYQMVLQWGDVAQLPAIVIYEETLPQVVEELTGGSIPYHRGSPYGGKGWDTADPTIGDVHQWNIWGGKELPWQEYPRLGGRFVSEFGIPSFPSMKTIEYWMEGVDPREWYAQSKVMAQHTRAGAFERRFAIVMNENFRLTADLEKHVFNTQIMQAEAVGLAYRSWKREWKKEGKRYCGGVLVWQFNDCWPVTSWSLVDYFLRAKPSFYVVARELAPITVGIFREVVQNRDNDRPRQFYEYGATRSTTAKLHIWATRAGTGGPPFTPLEVRLDLQYFDLDNPEWHRSHVFEVTESSVFRLPPNGSTELGTFDCPDPDPVQKYDSQVAETTSSGRVVVSARLLHPETGEILARFVDWPQPYRLLDIPPATAAAVQIDLTKEVGTDSTATVRITVNRPVKGLMLSLGGPACEGTSTADNSESPKWSDNALDVVPFDPQCVTVTGLMKEHRVQWTALQN